MTRVCLVAEGSYPYVTGGVGKWTHDLISSIPEVEFTVVALWPTPESPGRSRYPRPENLREVRNVYLQSGPLDDRAMDPGAFGPLEEFHRALLTGRACPLGELLRGLRAGRVLSDERSWDMLCRLYREFAPPDLSFPDFFWTWRATILPILRVLGAELPEADAVHSISTGYAGLLGAVHHARTGTPHILTEHGLYTRERTQELWDIDWIPGEEYARDRRTVNFFKDWWNRMFLSMERTAYASSRDIIALFEANRQYQVSHGAPEEFTRVIPNGVDLALFDGIRRRRRSEGPFHVGLVGRVVPIKDIRTFINAAKIVADRAGASRLKVSIIGPEDEDSEYARQCREMVRLLGLANVVTFTGRVDCGPYYEVLDVVVLTSLSEGQPLSVLEALACGIPVVATDVGACRELLTGRLPEDRELGPAGLVTLPADPEGTAGAILLLLEDPGLRRAMGRAGRWRAEKYYCQQRVREYYLQLYRSFDHGRR